MCINKAEASSLIIHSLASWFNIYISVRIHQLLTNLHSSDVVVIAVGSGRNLTTKHVIQVCVFVEL